MTMENPQPQFPAPSGHVRSMAVATAELWQDVLDRLEQVQASQAVVEQSEDRRRDLFAETITRAEILIDPDLHSRCLCSGSGGVCEFELPPGGR